MVIPAFGYGTKGAKFWLRLKQVPWFSPSPTHTPEAETEGGWEMATCGFDLQLTQDKLCALYPLKAQPPILFGFLPPLKPKAGY